MIKFFKENLDKIMVFVLILIVVGIFSNAVLVGYNNYNMQIQNKLYQIKIQKMIDETYKVW